MLAKYIFSSDPNVSNDSFTVLCNAGGPTPF
jgi:hypothetical protein